MNKITYLPNMEERIKKVKYAASLRLCSYDPKVKQLARETFNRLRKYKGKIKCHI